MLPTPYYEQDGIVIYHADAREILPLLPSVDVTITDPPWGVILRGKTAQNRGVTTFRAGSYSHPDTPEYVRDVAVPVVEQCREISKAFVVTPGIRNCFAYPQPDDMGCFYSASGTGMGRWGFTLMQPILYYGSDPYLRTRRGSRPNSHNKVYPNDANAIDHPCAKPIRSWLWLMERVSLPGETVLDPFVGSGTTLVAARQLGRKAIGIEIDERFCEVAVERLRGEALPMFSAPTQTQIAMATL